MAIPKVKDPAILELQNIVENKLAMPTKFVYANLFEANFEMDKLIDIEFPVFIFVVASKNNNKTVQSNEIYRKVKVYGFMLNKMDPSKSDAATAEIKSFDILDSIYQMRQLAWNLQYFVNLSPLSVNAGVDKWDDEDVYQKFDAHLFGVAVTFDWEIQTGTNGYYNFPAP